MIAIPPTSNSASVPADNNLVVGNYIGTNENGREALPNSGQGVEINDGANNTIGGTTVEASNLISGNAQDGIFIGDTVSPNTPDSNLIAGNLIGTDVTGANLLPNVLAGIEINSSAGNTIGGAAQGAGNLISGNDFAGVYIHEPTAAGNLLAGNFIGTDITGTTPVGNKGGGVEIDNAPGTTVGGLTAGARNIISANQQFGVALFNSGTTASLIVGNYFGSDLTGTQVLVNFGVGVFVDEAPGNTIGGTTPEAPTSSPATNPPPWTS